jgi:DNA-binding transcriptional ArsR family regulator
MSTFESDVELTDIVVRDTDVSNAVDEPVRAMILDMLAERSMTVEEVRDDLRSRGFDRTVNTIRHHVNELRDAGLVEVERMEERRGGTLKFYR